MTRKQALSKILLTVTDRELKEKIEEILNDMPFTKWNERTIFDTIDQFIIDNGRVPTVTDFKKKGLPPHTVIKLRFGINLKCFLDKYYPSNNFCSSKLYSHKSKEEWQKQFISEYHKNRPKNAKEYNNTRSKNTPSWATVAKLFNISKWTPWLSFCEVISCKNEYLQRTINTKVIQVTSMIETTTQNNKSFFVKKDGDEIYFTE